VSGEEPGAGDRPVVPPVPEAPAAEAEAPPVVPEEIVGGPPAVDEHRASRWIAVSLAFATAAGIAVMIVYALGGQPQAEGVLLAVLLCGIGIAFVFWGKYLFRSEIGTGARGPHASDLASVRATDAILARSAEQIGRRRFLVRMMLAAFGALGLAAVFPFRSLGPNPGDSLFLTPWRRGMLLVDSSGQPVRADSLELDGVLTVFPQHHVGANDAQAIIVRVAADRLRLPAGRAGWAPEGNVCYSKLCTHAGCPVGLYLAQYHELQCPCHYSAFDVLRGAVPVFGPATTPLPQLPLTVDAEGYLRAGGGFSAPVGPGFWNRNKGPVRPS
jgi:ubiquinol-cytochrome c reductase iron-sulfur subunit